MTTLNITDDVREGDLLSITPPADWPGYMIARVTTRERCTLGAPGEKPVRYAIRVIVLIARSEQDALSGHGIYLDWWQRDLTAHHAAQTGRRVANPLSPRIETRGPNEYDGLAIRLARRGR